MAMEFWLADADPDRVSRAMASGVFSGVITNPAVVSATKTNPEKLFAKLCELAPVCWYQLRHGSESEMIEEANRMVAVDPKRMRIKVPSTRAGLAVIKQLKAKGWTVMATCVPTAPWMMLACAAGADYIAPYGSMLQKRGIHGKYAEVRNMQALIDRQQMDVKICTGLYSVTEIEDFAAVGVKAGFVWGKDVEDFLTQPIAEEAVQAFEKDWDAIGGY